ncbi:hypothetical protein NDU88_002141 [Pleurodeles waltl]|uniref:Uncharacterized protein n=1 Tax=Pleurodeles waltl TaxID=8319 RepID=A0AAV7R957_PLEWA|nr:hypothetical protein NDU88_002141 [Pleurodeles waltl]
MPRITTGCAPAALMFSSPPRDCIPEGDHWQPIAKDMSKTQEKWARTNAKASERRRAKHPDLRVEESVILKDRHPGWKYRTPYKPDILRVERIKGTKVTASREGRQVTWNVLWFWKVEPWEGDLGAGFEGENGEEFEQSCPSQPSSPDGCRQGDGSDSRRD